MVSAVVLFASLACTPIAGAAEPPRDSQPAARGLVIQARDVVALQREPEDAATGRYDWGPSVMLDGGLYRMWWVRLGGPHQRRFPYSTTLPDGHRFEFTYPDWGDRIYYAESRDGRRWHLSGAEHVGPPERFGPDADGPMRVLSPAESDHERYHVGDPSVIRVGGTFYMYYEAPSEFVCRRRPDGGIIVSHEYHNQIFVATSTDGRTWHKHPEDRRPQPIVRAPEENKQPGRRRYGLGQPSVCYRRGRFILHYVDSCTGPGDFIVRIEADGPLFRNPRVFAGSLSGPAASGNTPPGAVARFAQADVKYLGDVFHLVRPAYGTGRLGLLAAAAGVFESDAAHHHPRDVFPQVNVPDPRGAEYTERLYPCFLTDPHGEIAVRDNRAILYYGSGRPDKANAFTWDLHRGEVDARGLSRP